MTRLSKKEALELFVHAPLDELKRQAMGIRQKKHGSLLVSYVLDTNPNYTNICTLQCSFCAFCRETPKYHKTPVQVLEHVKKAAAINLSTVLLQGGIHPEVTVDYLVELVRLTKKHYPHITPHYFSAPEVWHAAATSRISVEETLCRLTEAGQKTLPGGGAEILSERVHKKISPKKLSPKQWIDVHKIAHSCGMKTTATMMYGHVETAEDIIEHLDILRSLQDETGGFYSFIPWSYKNGNNPLSAHVTKRSGPEDYFRTIAFSRIFLDNFDHIAASWFGEGKETGWQALLYGADDFGGTLFEESVHKAAGYTNQTSVAEIRSLIAKAGFEPTERNSSYFIKK